MAVYSMTGYASATVPGAAVEAGGSENSSPASSVTVELRSVNSRFLDLAFRMPDDLRGLEPAMREAIGAAFKRGNVELRLASQRESDSAWPSPTPEQLNRLSRLESTVQGWLSKAAPLSVNEALQWCRGGGSVERLDEAALRATRQAVAGLREARAREGERLVQVLQERIARLRELAKQAQPVQGLLLGLDAGGEFAGRALGQRGRQVFLQGHQPALFIFSKVDDAKTTGRQFLDDLVAADHGTRRQRGGFWL